MTMDTNSPMAITLGRKVSIEYPMTSMTSEGLKLPRDARPSVRISVTVITTVTRTISVAP